MIRENSEIQLHVDGPVSPMEKNKLEQEIKQMYGSNVDVKVKGKKVRNENFQENRKNIHNNNLKAIYEKYLDDNYTGIDKDLFFQLDEQITNLVPDVNKGAKKFKVKNISGKNILSFSDFEVNLDNRGILRVYSTPQNMGGKSNLIRILKILLFGEFYRSNQERSTLPSIINRFSPLNIAHIEGEIEIEGKIYYIRRDFTRNDKGKVSQKILVTCEGEIISTDQFENMLGMVKNFLFISFYDSFSIEKWLNTKPTERYRMFLSYFGLDNIEDKAKVARQQYADFRKNSIVRQYQDTDIDEYINLLKNDINSLNNINENVLSKAIEEDEKEIVGLQSEIDRLKNQLKGVPDSLLNETEDSLKEKIRALEYEISQKENNINELKNSIIVVTSSKEELQKNINELQDKISKVEADKDLISTLDSFNYLYNNYVTPSILKQLKEDAEKIILKLREQYMAENANKKAKEELLLNTPDSSVCNLCNGVSDNKDKKQKLEEEIFYLNGDLELLVEKGNDAKKALAKIESHIKDEELEYKKDLNKQIEEAKKAIEQNKQEKITKIKNDIFAVQTTLNNLIEAERKESKIDLLNAETKAIEGRVSEFKQRLANIQAFNNDLDFNKNLNTRISELVQTLNAVQSKLITNKAEVKINENAVQSNQIKLKQALDDRDKIVQEVKLDKVYSTYIDVHSKGGLAMQILHDLAQEINDDLADILSEDDFKPFIKIESDAIEFYFERNGVEFNMAEGSGYEKTVLLLSLHYLLLSKMVVPISNIFILDEVFVAVALPYLNRAYKVVENYLNIFETILLITHVEEIGSWCNDEIKIEKTNNISKIV